MAELPKGGTSTKSTLVPIVLFAFEGGGYLFWALRSFSRMSLRHLFIQALDPPAGAKLEE